MFGCLYEQTLTITLGVSPVNITQCPRDTLVHRHSYMPVCLTVLFAQDGL